MECLSNEDEMFMCVPLLCVLGKIASPLCALCFSICEMSTVMGNCEDCMRQCK